MQKRVILAEEGAQKNEITKYVGLFRRVRRCRPLRICKISGQSPESVDLAAQRNICFEIAVGRSGSVKCVSTINATKDNLTHTLNHKNVTFYFHYNFG